mmetsp:Transcript_29165/g.93360  ORF Transcript_29165/g.93360 Transcript_29165/m.93360 type:complete len:232 (-) Transcript_29165:383-1078(-)
MQRALLFAAVLGAARGFRPPALKAVRGPGDAVAAEAPFERTWSNPECLALRKYGEGVWLAERPFVWNSIDVGGRSVVVRLPSGGLWVHSPVELDAALKKELADIGPVECIVSPNYEHVKYAQQWIDAYPDAAALVCPGGIEKFPDIAFTAELPQDGSKCDVFGGAIDFVFMDCEKSPFSGAPFFNEYPKPSPGPNPNPNPYPNHNPNPKVPLPGQKIQGPHRDGLLVELAG